MATAVPLHSSGMAGGGPGTGPVPAAAMAAGAAPGKPAQQAMAAPAAPGPNPGDQVSWKEEDIRFNQHLCCPDAMSCCLSAIFPCGWLCSCEIVSERQAKVVTVFGKPSGYLSEPGCWCVNPCGTESKNASLRIVSMDLPNSKVSDARGNPILVSAVLTFRVKEPMRAALLVTNVTSYVQAQALAVVKATCQQYPYSSDDPDEEDLMEEGELISRRMVEDVQRRVTGVGIEILTMSLTDLSYAPEVAPAMLARQQAAALVEARHAVVRGAVDICTEAIQRLADEGIALSDEEQTQLVGRLLAVVVGDQSRTPNSRQ